MRWERSPGRQTSVAATRSLCYLWVQVGNRIRKPPRSRKRRSVIILFKGWHAVEAVNRKLIRPSLNEIKEQITPPRRAPAAQQKKPVPPDQTNAENFYYVKQMQA